MQPRISGQGGSLDMQRYALETAVTLVTLTCTCLDGAEDFPQTPFPKALSALWF